MRKIYELVKENYPLVIGTIIVYQVLLCIFFFSTQNLKILGIIIVVIAAYTVLRTYKDKIIGFFKK